MAPIPSENITITRATFSCAIATSFKVAMAASSGQPRASSNAAQWSCGLRGEGNPACRYGIGAKARGP